MKNLLNKTVTVHLGVVPGFTDSIKGEVIEVLEDWVKIQTKNSKELIKISTIKRISEK